MTTGEGGVIVTENEQWGDLFRSLRNQGRYVFDTWLEHSRLGFNYRMDELSAALGSVQVQRPDEILSRRQSVADRNDRRLANVDGVTTLQVAPSTTRKSWFVYVVRLDERTDRDQVVRRLQKRGIPTRPYFLTRFTYSRS